MASVVSTICPRSLRVAAIGLHNDVRGGPIQGVGPFWTWPGNLDRADRLRRDPDGDQHATDLAPASECVVVVVRADPIPDVDALVVDEIDGSVPHRDGYRNALRLVAALPSVF